MAAVRDILRNATKCLEQAGIENAEHEVEIILSTLTGRDRAWLFAHPDELLAANKERQVEKIINQRISQRQPLAYLLGHQDFAGYNFTVSPATLIPRSETEGLVERTSQRIQVLGLGRSRLIDVGTGSGVIAISLKLRFPSLDVSAVDISKRALAVAAKNAERHNVEIRFTQSDLLTQAPIKHEVIVANLPYGLAGDWRKWKPEVHHEPKRAIIGGQAGLDLITRLLKQIQRLPRLPQLVALEIDASQGQTLAKLCARLLPSYRFELEADLAGRDRYVFLTLASRLNPASA